MAFLKLNDESASCEAVVFPAVWKKVYTSLKEGELLFAEGRFDHSRQRVQFIVEKLVPVRTLKSNKQILYLRLTGENKEEASLLAKIKGTLEKFPGETPVILYFEENKKTMALGSECYAESSDECLLELEQLLGKAHVVLK